MIWSQVTGLLMSGPYLSTNDLRYHSTWVLDQNGATTSWPSHVAASTALGNACSSNFACMSAEMGGRYTAAEDSAVNGGSMLIRAMSGSSAASRRASWMRCCPASC